MKKKILITGGAGFIGYNLCKFLIKKNFNVICLDNFVSSKKKKINHLLQYKNFKLIRKDVTKKYNIKADEIYNLACIASPKLYQKIPLTTLLTNINGTINTLNNAHFYKAKIFHASTSEIYGDPLIHPQSENYYGNVNTMGPRSCYDEGKRCAETLFYEYNNKFRLKTKIGRIFNTYGPYMMENDGRVISNFVINSLKNKPLIIYGNGQTSRSFCYVDDLISNIYEFMKTSKNIIGPINLGNPSEIKIIELANLIKKITSSKSEIKFINKPKDDPNKRKPNVSLAKKYIKNFSTKTSLDQGLIKTIEYFDSII